MKRLCILMLSVLLLFACAEEIAEKGDNGNFITFNVTEVGSALELDADVTTTRVIPLLIDSMAQSDIVLTMTRKPSISKQSAADEVDSPIVTRTAPIGGNTILAANATFNFSEYNASGTRQYMDGTATVQTAATSNNATPAVYSTSNVTTNKTWPSDAATSGDSHKYTFYAWKTANNISTSDGKTFAYNISSVSPAAVGDLVTASSGAVNYSVAGPTLAFCHPLSAIIINTASGFKGTITSVTFKNIYLTGTHTAGNASFSATGNKGNKTISGLSVVDGSKPVFGSETTLMMLPQTFSGASIEITVNDATQTNPQVVHTLTANLTGSWTAGNTYIYTIGSSTISAISLTYPQWALSSDANTKDYGAVGSYTTATAASNAGYGFIGLYAIDNNNNIVICNAKLSINSVSNHTASCALPTSLGICSANYSYYAYYPYSLTANTNIGAAINGSTTKKADNTNQTVNKSTNAATFFANLIDKWAVKTSQSTLANYHLSDLQVGKGSVSNGTLSFTMAHQMGLAKFSLQDKNIVTRKKYLDKSGNTYTYVWTDDATALQAHSSRTFSTNIPYAGSSNYYYYVVKKSTNTNFSATDNLSATYPYADVPNNSWSESNVNIASGTYKVITKTPAITCSEITKHTLAAGDIMYNTGALSTDLNTNLGTPVGLVFYTETTAEDKAIDADLKHGYAMALKYANNNSGKDVHWCTGTYTTLISTDGLLTPRATIKNNSNQDVEGMGDIISTGLLQSGETEQQYRVRAIRTDMNGLKHCTAAKAHDAENMYAIARAESHNTYTGIPLSSTTTTAGSVTLKSPKTSGWYVPSIGQYYQWIKHCCPSITGSENYNYRKTTSNYAYSSTTDGSNNAKDFNYIIGNFPTHTEENASRHLTKEIDDYHKTTKGLTSYYTSLYYRFWFWTSTENYANIVFVFNFDGTNVYMDGRQGYGVKGTQRNSVWPVLAF